MQQQLQALFLQCALGGSPYGALLHQNQQQQQQQQQTQALQSLQHLSLQPHTLGALAGLVGGADVAGGLGGAAGSAGISGISSSLFDQVQLISLLAQQQQQQQQHQQQQYVQQQQVQAQQAQAQQQEGVAATRQVPDQLLQIQQEILLRQILQSVTPAQMQDEVHKQLPQAAIQKNVESGDVAQRMSAAAFLQQQTGTGAASTPSAPLKFTKITKPLLSASIAKPIPLAISGKGSGRGRKRKGEDGRDGGAGEGRQWRRTANEDARSVKEEGGEAGAGGAKGHEKMAMDFLVDAGPNPPSSAQTSGQWDGGWRGRGGSPTGGGSREGEVGGAGGECVGGGWRCEAGDAADTKRRKKVIEEEEEREGMTSGMHAASSRGEGHCQSVGAVATKKAIPPKKRGKVPVLTKAEEQERIVRCASPSEDQALPVSSAEIRAQVDELIRLGRAEKAALKTEMSEWEWCRKRLVGNGTGLSRGSQPYMMWWGIFNKTLAISKRAVNEDVRYIHSQAPSTKSVSKEVSEAPPRKEWLVVGNFVECKWDNEWWQAKIKKVKVEKSTDKIEKVFVSYVGGTTDEDEWIPFSSRRIRPPTMGFSDTTSGI